MTGSKKSGRFGAPEQVGVERGLAEFRAGRPVIFVSATEWIVAFPVDGMNDATLGAFRDLCSPGRPHLVITARRARTLGLDGTEPTGLAIGDLHDSAAIFQLATDRNWTRRLEIVPAGPGAGAAIVLAKLALRLPALLACRATSSVHANDPPLIRVAAHAVAPFRQSAIKSLAIAAD